MLVVSSMCCVKTNRNVPSSASRSSSWVSEWVSVSLPVCHQIVSASILSWKEVPPKGQDDVQSSPEHWFQLFWIHHPRSTWVILTSTFINSDSSKQTIHSQCNRFSAAQSLFGSEAGEAKTYRCFQVSLVGPIEGRGGVPEVLLKAHIESDWHSQGYVWKKGAIFKNLMLALRTHRTQKHLLDLIPNSHSANEYLMSSYLPLWSWQKGPLGGSPLRQLQRPAGALSCSWQVRLWRHCSWGHL